jgi:hypothetical protein
MSCEFNQENNFSPPSHIVSEQGKVVLGGCIVGPQGAIDQYVNCMSEFVFHHLHPIRVCRTCCYSTSKQCPRLAKVREACGRRSVLAPWDTPPAKPLRTPNPQAACCIRLLAAGLVVAQKDKPQGSGAKNAINSI